jgi:transposase
MPELPDLSQLAHEEKDALIRALWAQVQALTSRVQTLVARVAGLKAKLGQPPKTPDNSSLPPSQGKKPNRPEKAKRHGPRPGSLNRMGGGRLLAETPRRDRQCQAGAVRALPGGAGRGGPWCCTGATTRSTCPRFRRW